MKYIALVLMLMTLLLPGCKDMGVEPPPPTMRALTLSEQRLVQANDKFWLKILKEINNDDSAKNVFISPLSISFALSMALNGADGETYAAMRSTMELGEMPLEEINASYKSLMQTLSTVDPKVRLQIANSIWYREGFPVESDFINTNKTYFDAIVRALNFSSPDAASTINAWVNEKTNGKISKIVESPIPPEMVMYLINALYFKGAWTHRFKPDQTRDGQFTLRNGSTINCKMMNQEGSFSTSSNDRFTAVDLPYGHRIFSMTILLPRSGLDINEFISTFTQTEWHQAVENLSEQNILLSMPKFKLEYKLYLIEPLKALGMEIAFDRARADFRRISQAVYQMGQRLYISEAKHKTFLEVNEEGTEAAAVTSIGIGLTSGPPSIRIDRPFLCVIRERSTGTVLFVGKILNPNG
jgi:serine protease inhibitor